jgi:hypothetical protein
MDVWSSYVTAAPCYRLQAIDGLLLLQINLRKLILYLLPAGCK